MKMKKFQEFVNEKSTSNNKHERKCKKACDDKNYVSPNSIEKENDECKLNITEESRRNQLNKIPRLLSRLNKLQNNQIMEAIRINAEITALGTIPEHIKVHRLLRQLNKLGDNQVMDALQLTAKLNVLSLAVVNITLK